MSFFSELSRRNVFRVAIAYSVVAWLVAQIAELALDSFGTPDWVMKTILLVLVLGLPIAILFAWAFELTPEGIKLEKDVDRSQSITQTTGRKLNYTIIGVLAATLVLAIATRDMRFGSEESEPQPVAAEEQEKSIAVLPFVNMSDDPDNEYFSDGISEELLNVLVKVEGLRVASRTSSFSFKGKDTSIPDIADALNVEHVLEGSVRKAGDTVRITAQLIDVRTDSHLWSETYDRKFEDIFVIQDEISAHIVDALRVALGTGEVVRTAARPTDDLAAYEDYLKARHFWQRRGGENIQRAIELFTKATEADPGFARAWSGLGAAHLTMPTYSGEPEEQHFPLALEYANRSLDLDPSIAEAHATLADLLRFDRRWSEAEVHYLKAIELEPRNSTGYLWYAEQLVATGRKEAALTTALRALELDPFHAGTSSMAAFAFAINDEIEQTVKYSQSAWELGHPGGLFQLIQYQIISGNLEEASRLVETNAEAITPPMYGNRNKFN
jgi:TolB-like protein